MEQHRGEEGGEHECNDGASGPGNERAVPHGLRERLGGGGDYDGVVTAQRKIDHQNREHAENGLPIYQSVKGVHLSGGSRQALAGFRVKELGEALDGLRKAVAAGRKS